ncbi:MAG: TonB-dependent receptor [Bacteroidaceae bacterium]|nr:TonB-dependent receptor [Bacteroidaceae bacterium]
MFKQKCRVPRRALALVCGLLLSLGAFAQGFVAKGVVKDAAGEPVIGATVRVKGAQGGAITDFDGNFQLNCTKGQELEISYIGMETQSAAASDGMIITLKEDAGQSLNEVVVIGYGAVKKNDLTGSVATLKPDEKNHGLITSAQEMIQGKIAGVNVNMGSGEPGGGAMIRIRGGASLNASNDPLIVIDGMVMDNNATKGMSNPLSLVNPNDIESFSVLKDASATAIYGSRGSNGVIIITTKKGTKGSKPKVTYNGNVSIATKTKTLDVMNASQYTDFIKNYYGEDSPAYLGLGWKQFNDDGTPNFAAGTYDTNWQDEIYRTAVSTDHNISVSGGIGTSKMFSMPYRVSVGYTGQQGILKGSNYKRFTAGLNLSPSLFDSHLNMNLNGKFVTSKSIPGAGGAIGDATRFDPTRPVTSTADEFKNWGGYWQFVTPSEYGDPTYPYAKNPDAPGNPVEQVMNYGEGYKKTANVFMGNFEADYKIHGLEDLRLHMNLAGEWTNGEEITNFAPNTSHGYYYGSYGNNEEKRVNLTASGYIQYYKDFNENHHFDVMAGYEWSHFKYKGNSESYGMYPSTSPKKDDAGNPLAGTKYDPKTGKWESEHFIVSWFGRMNYTLLERYLFTFTMRADGSSRFAKGKKWGYFPSAAIAWRAKDEPFLKNVEAVSDAKLRLGWGITGQQDLLGKDYYYLPRYEVSTTTQYTYPVGGDGNGVLYKPKEYNTELTWEKTTTYNIGIDLGFFNQRLTLTVDGYIRKTKDLLNNSTVTTGSNFNNTVMSNVGSLENKGVEVSVTGRPIQKNGWYWEITANAGYNQNKITELYGGRDVIEAGMQVGTNEAITYHKIGMPANTFYVYQQVYDENGRPIMGCYVDRNGDGQINDADRYYYKSTTAPWTAGLSSRLQYKNWDLGFNFRASFGNYVYNNLLGGKANVATSYNSKGFYDNTTLELVKMGWTSYNYSRSDYFVQNASFVKCDNITLGYNFDKLFTDKITGRIYASVSNVFTITKYKGLDPEQNDGKESALYPRPRTFLLGLTLNF